MQIDDRQIGRNKELCILHPASEILYRTFEAAYMPFPMCISLSVSLPTSRAVHYSEFCVNYSSFFCTDFPTNISLCLLCLFYTFTQMESYYLYFPHELLLSMNLTSLNESTLIFCIVVHFLSAVWYSSVIAMLQCIHSTDNGNLIFFRFFAIRSMLLESCLQNVS